MQKFKLGIIEKITEIPLKNDPTHKRIIINLQWSKRNPKSITIQKKLSTDGSIKLVYEMPWYWKIVTTHPQK
jgi:hypothetical protein